MDYSILLIYIYVFFIGACVASFANVVSYRIPKHESVVTGRSYCDNCHTQIKSYDLIPIISYLLLRGKCRSCHQHIPIEHCLVELVGGGLALLSFIVYGLSINALVVFIITMILMVIALIDYHTMDIYLGTLIALLIMAIVYLFINPMPIKEIVLGAISVAIPMFLLTLIIPGSFGFGDVELMFVTGILLGWQNNLLALFIGIIIGGVYAAKLLVTKKVTGKEHIAFGPYLVVGIIISLLYGTMILNWYFSLFTF